MNNVAVLQEQRERRRATLAPWFCEGTIPDGELAGRPCRKVLLELDWDRPSYLRITCKRCKHTNVFVESYRPPA